LGRKGDFEQGIAADGVSVRQLDRFNYTPGRGIVTKIRDEEIVVGNRMHLRDVKLQGSDHLRGTSTGPFLNWYFHLVSSHAPMKPAKTTTIKPGKTLVPKR